MNQQNNDQKTLGVHVHILKVGFLDVRLGSCYGIG